MGRDVHGYYLNLAQNADLWARGLTMIDGGQNLLDMADMFDEDALCEDFVPDMQDAFRTLAGALRKHVKAAHDFYTAGVDTDEHD